MASFILAAPYSKAECRRRLVACLDGRLTFRWITWASASPTRRLLGRFDGDVFRAVIVGPVTPRALAILPRPILALPMFQSGVQVLTVRLIKGPHGAQISGEIDQPTVEHVLLIGAVCSAAAILRADPLFFVAIAPAVVLFRYVNAIRWRVRMATDSVEMVGRIGAALQEGSPTVGGRPTMRPPGSNTHTPQEREVMR
jgi:hypothetical protein